MWHQKNRTLDLLIFWFFEHFFLQILTQYTNTKFEHFQTNTNTTCHSFPSIAHNSQMLSPMPCRIAIVLAIPTTLHLQHKTQAISTNFNTKHSLHHPKATKYTKTNEKANKRSNEAYIMWFYINHQKLIYNPIIVAIMFIIMVAVFVFVYNFDRSVLLLFVWSNNPNYLKILWYIIILSILQYIS